MTKEDQAEHGTNPMCEVFPRIAACNYVRYGSGGGQSKIEAICILGMNMINDKVCQMKFCQVIDIKNRLRL